MNSREDAAHFCKRGVKVALTLKGQSGERSNRLTDDGVSCRLIPVRQHATKHCLTTHCANDGAENA